MRASLPTVLALLLVLTACGGSDGAQSAPPSAATSATSSATATAAAGPPVGAMSIMRTANGFTVTGEVPDEGLQAALPDTLRQAFPGAKIVADLTVKPGVTAPEFAGLGALFASAMDIQGFGTTLVGGTATLTGTTASDGARSAAEAALTATWPNVVVVDDVRVTGAGPCATPGADVDGLLKTPITFATDQATLAPDARRLVAKFATAVAACRGTRLAVVGFTDDTGGDAINGPLSARRAKAVADALVSGGVTGSAVTSRGAGAANPVADNATAAGRAQNRRVAITVG